MAEFKFQVCFCLPPILPQERKHATENCVSDLAGDFRGWVGGCSIFYFFWLLLSMLIENLSFQIQNIKQTNSALKEKLEGGIEEYRLPEVSLHTSRALCFYFR